MNKIINATRRRFAISPSALDWHRLCWIGLAAVAAALQSAVAMAQWSDNGRALIDAASNPLAFSPYPHGGQPLRPSDVSHVLRDWGLRLLSGPARSATSYQAIVRDDAGQDLFVAVDAYDGRILNLDLTDRALGIASISRSGDGERLDRESSGPVPQLGEAPASISEGRRKAQAATWITSPRAAPRPPVRKTTSGRLAAVEPSAEFRAPKGFAPTPHVSQVPQPSAGLAWPRRETTPRKAPTLTPTKAQPASSALRTTPPAVERDVSTSATQAVSDAQKFEKQHAKPVIPADAGFD
jgi:hypothetical protein